jgi:hypothetical protein
MGPPHPTASRSEGTSWSVPLKARPCLANSRRPLWTRPRLAVGRGILVRCSEEALREFDQAFQQLIGAQLSELAAEQRGAA